MRGVLSVLGFAAVAFATPVVYDGRASFSLKDADLDTSTGPFLTVVKGTESATRYSDLLGHSLPPTPLWSKYPIPFLPIFGQPTEQPVSITITNTSVFYPGGNNPQFGFRRTELLAQGATGGPGALRPVIGSGVKAFHFSIGLDETRPLNYKHEYQVVFVEPDDGSHIFGVQLGACLRLLAFVEVRCADEHRKHSGSPFTNPTGPLPAPNARSFKILDHALNVLFTAPFTARAWHNFAVVVDWDKKTLKVFYSKDAAPLKAVTKTVPNLSVPAGTAVLGDFHVGVLKLPLVNPADSPENQGDVVRHGIQEGTTEGLLYSGVFVESVSGGISLGLGKKAFA
ncbi:hypothetical protein HGRIS_002030 [Hohenbuehelia grisea]|uniref:Glycoside hydrolase 131 catalytic N-terminal domain-containing protein n=1 Tax=Hohenbuehelia grisea TaxID=104357 RepID=A0ABR3JJE4_9AGAR